MTLAVSKAHLHHLLFCLWNFLLLALDQWTFFLLALWLLHGACTNSGRLDFIFPPEIYVKKLSKADIILWRIGSESQHARYLQETFFFHCWQFFCYCSTWCSVWWSACSFVGWNAGQRGGKHYHPYCQLTTAARNSVDCITQPETHGQSSRCKLWTLQYSCAKGNHLGVCWKSVDSFSFWQSYQFASTSLLWTTTLDLSGYMTAYVLSVKNPCTLFSWEVSQN